MRIPAPLNAAIALSILFLGPEIVRSRRGETSFTIRHPWVVAFAFGPLHGFGFASGLTALGLPRGDIPLALLMFNVDVEIGQLAFLALILLLVRAFKVIDMRWPRWAERAPAYVVGSRPVSIAPRYRDRASRRSFCPLHCTATEPDKLSVDGDLRLAGKAP